MACPISHFDDVTFVRKIHSVSFVREQVWSVENYILHSEISFFLLV